MYDVWYNPAGGYYDVPGSGSDYVSFAQNGISSMDVSFYTSPDDPAYHFHSNYNSFHWMET